MTQAPGHAESEEFYPEFLIVRRGYDPDQVEQVLDDLYSTLEQTVRQAQDKASALREAEHARHELSDALARAEHRIAELERRPSEQGKPSFDNIGTSVAQILQAATAEAAEIRRRANDEAQSLQHESEAAAVTSRVESDHYAADVRARADDEANTLISHARAEADRLLTDARDRQESQERAAVEAHERRIVSLTAQIDALAVELRQARGRAQTDADSAVAEAHATASRLVEQAKQYRAQVRDEIAFAHAQIVAAMTAAGLPAPERRIPIREPRPRNTGDDARPEDVAGVDDPGAADASDEPVETDTGGRATAASSGRRR